MNEEKLTRLLEGLSEPFRVICKKTSPSTNTELKTIQENRIVILTADEQTQGRGRTGHSFHSPKGGLYMSVLIPQLSFDPLITPAAAVAARSAVWEISGKQLQIKWVNDLYLMGRKVAGILTEITAQGVIIGIGVNIGDTAFPPELDQIAGSIGAADPEQLAAAIVLRLTKLLRGLPDKSFLSEYRAHDYLSSKTVSFVLNGISHTATAQGIDDDGALIVLCENGQTLRLMSGEVSVRPA